MPDFEPSFRTERFRFLKSKAQLDLMRIDEALEEIAVLVQDAGECVAFANEIRDAAKNDLAIAEAEEAAILRGTQLSNGKYPSEYALPSLLPLSDKVKEAMELLSKARLDAALWATVANALMTKSTAIRTTADLISSGFLTNDFVRARRRKEIREAVP
jgi:hypothetical protein